MHRGRAGEGPYRDLRDALWRLGLGREALTHLAAVGAFAPFGLGRRAAIWAVGTIADLPDLLAGEPLAIPDLPPFTSEEEIRLDLAYLGTAPGGRHLVGCYREQLARWRVTRASDLDGVAHGAPVRVAGAVTVRQQPGTAAGVVFLTLEDETGAVNVVVMPDVYARARRTIRLAPLLAVAGFVQRAEGVTHVRATRVRAFGDAETHALVSKQFT